MKDLTQVKKIFQGKKKRKHTPLSAWKIFAVLNLNSNILHDESFGQPYCAIS